MSTLRTDTLQTTDSTYSVSVTDLLGAPQIRSGFSATVETIASLRTVSKLLFNSIYVKAYSSATGKGGGQYRLDPTDITSADNGGTIIVNPVDGGRWKLAQHMAPDVYQFGAFGDGVTDDTEPLQRAISNCVKLRVTQGSFLSSELSIANECIIEGDAALAGSSKILAKNATDNLLKVSGSSVKIRNLYIGSKTGQQTGGSYVVVSGFGRVTLDSLEMWNAYNGYTVTASTNVTIKSPRAFSSKGSVFTIDGGFNHTIIDPHADNPTGNQPVSGLRVTSVGDLTVTGGKMLQCGTALLVDVSDGAYVNSLVVNQTFFDSSTLSGRIRSSGTGQVQRVDLTDCWFGNSASQGLVISNTGSGQVDGITLNNCRNVLCVGDGLEIGANVKNVRVNGGQFSQCTGSGISVAANSELLLSNAVIGAADGLSSNATGLFLSSGASGQANNVKFGSNATAVVNGSTNFKLSNCVGYKTSATGIFTGTTSVNGELTIPHGLALAPIFATAVVNEFSAAEVVVTSSDATNIIVRVRNTNDNSSVASVIKTVRWTASL